MTVEMWNQERFFSCAEERWRQLLDLGRRNGWNPAGTSRAPRRDELQDLTSGALGPDAHYPDAPDGEFARDFARELFATSWRAAHVARGYGIPPYPEASYVSSVDAYALAAALERGLAEVRLLEEKRSTTERFAAVSVWFVGEAINFMRRGGFLFGSSD